MAHAQLLFAGFWPCKKAISSVAPRGYRYIVLFMPTLTRTGGSTEFDLNKVACQFAFTMEDNYVVYGFIGNRKFEKHILSVDFDPAVHATKTTTHEWRPWGVINLQKGKHTAIAPVSFGAIRPLYEFFARDFIGEFRKKGEKALNAELEYTKQELGGYVSRGIDIRNDIDSYNFQFLVVGAIVKNLAAGKVKQSPVAGPLQTGSIPVVFFQHGPYVRT
jgi:hypothetical protein